MTNLNQPNEIQITFKINATHRKERDPKQQIEKERGMLLKHDENLVVEEEIREAL